MKQTKVMSVFDGIEMQKYFLYLTKAAQESAYESMVESLDLDINFNDFMLEVKTQPKLKSLIQEMILYSIANIDWESSLADTLDKIKWAKIAHFIIL